MDLKRRAILAAAGTVALAGCVEGNDTTPGGAEESDPEDTPTATEENTGSASTVAEAETATATPDGADPTPTEEPTETPTEGDGGSAESGAVPPTRETRLPLPMDPSDVRAEAESGGPPKDGIPSIDSPTFVDAGDAPETLTDDDVVFGLVRDGAVKAYPQYVLVWHEICNDTVGGDPVSVTYCPLTGTAMGFARGETTFGVSGRLINNNLVMYDRGTETWWPQVLASSIPGPWNESPEERSLREFRLVWTTWGQWRSLHPDTRVLSEDTGHVRNYGRDPYGGYNPKAGYYKDSRTLFPPLNPDDTFQAKRVVIGTRTPEGAAAFLKDALREAGTMTGDVGGDPVVAVYDDRLDTGYLYRNPDGKAVGVDGGTASVDGTSHDPDALPLERLYAFDAMWFAWHGFYPDTNVYE